MKENLLESMEITSFVGTRTMAIGPVSRRTNGSII